MESKQLPLGMTEQTCLRDPDTVRPGEGQSHSAGNREISWRLTQYGQERPRIRWIWWDLVDPVGSGGFKGCQDGSHCGPRGEEHGSGDWDVWLSADDTCVTCVLCIRYLFEYLWVK